MVGLVCTSVLGIWRTTKRTHARSMGIYTVVWRWRADAASSKSWWRYIGRELGPVALVLMACVTSAVEARPSTKDGLAMPLESMTFADAEKGGAVGSGCKWSGGLGGKGRMSMAGDRGAVKLNGRIVGLKPALGAKEVFPFTYHRWAGSGMDISIRETAKVVGRGGESVVTVAWLDLTQAGRTRSWRGRLDCGS